MNSHGGVPTPSKDYNDQDVMSVLVFLGQYSREEKEEAQNRTATKFEPGRPPAQPEGRRNVCLSETKDLED